MQGPALIVRQIVTFVVGDEVDNGPLGQGGRFVENQPSFFDAGAERAHALTLRISEVLGKHSRRASEAFDSLKPGHDLVPTGWH